VPVFIAKLLPVPNSSAALLCIEYRLDGHPSLYRKIGIPAGEPLVSPPKRWLYARQHKRAPTPVLAAAIRREHQVIVLLAMEGCWVLGSLDDGWSPDPPICRQAEQRLGDASVPSGRPLFWIEGTIRATALLTRRPAIPIPPSPPCMAGRLSQDKLSVKPQN
jgi:hypothetical protein